MMMWRGQLEPFCHPLVRLGDLLMGQQGDVLIRNAFPDAYSLTMRAPQRGSLAGRFVTLVDALAAARLLSHGGAIWRENVDQHGRPLGEAIRLVIVTA